MKKFLFIILLLPSCVQFTATSGAKYSGPPWGKVAYQKGDELFTGDWDAGWVATVTAVQNAATSIGGAYIAGQVTKSVTNSNNALDLGKTRSNNALEATKARLNTKPTIVTPPQQAVFP